MAIAIRSTGSWSATSAASITQGLTGEEIGDMMILVAAGKPFDMGWSVGTAGWTSAGRGESGTTAAGVDTGSMALQVWYKEATSAAETDPTVTEGSPAWNVAQVGYRIFSKGAGETWVTPVVVFGADETNGTDISVTFASDPGGVAGDYVVLACGINTDAMGPLTTALTPSWTGITFGGADSAQNAEGITGGDMAAHMTSRSVTSGTSSAAPTVTGTGTASAGADRLEACFIRLRVTTAAAANPPYRNPMIQLLAH